MIRRISLIVLFVFVTGSTWWLVSTLQYTSIKTTKKSKPEYTGPNHYMIDFSVTSTDESGLPKQYLTATDMFYYSHDDRTEIKKPNITFYQRDENKQPTKQTSSWNINADQGTVLNNGKKVVLTGNVIIKGRNQRQAPLTISTDELLVLPDEDFAETDKPIHIIQGSNTVDAIGAKFYLNQEILELVSKVRGKYVPNT